MRHAPRRPGRLAAHHDPDGERATRRRDTAPPRCVQILAPAELVAHMAGIIQAMAKLYAG